MKQWTKTRHRWESQQQHRTVVLPIGRLIAKGNFFGKDTEDEFTISFRGRTLGAFKAMEYLSLPFSITGNSALYDKLIENAKVNDTSFDAELKKDDAAQDIVNTVFDRMNTSPNFTRQTLEFLLPRVYIKDNTLMGSMPSKMSFSESVARTIFAWEQLADFYCIEGLVGGAGKNNPFLNNGQAHSLTAGTLDCLEQILPSVVDGLSQYDKNKVLLQLSAVVERDYKDIGNAIGVLNHIHGLKQISEEERASSIKNIGTLSREVLDKNIEHGKLFNTLIRFHNWMDIGLRSGDASGSAYDSICIPAKTSLNVVGEDVKSALSSIVDATSPKGIAISRLLDEGLIGDRTEVGSILAELNSPKNLESAASSGHRYFRLDADDTAFYSGICGGKWKGIKLLNDAKDLLGCSYSVPEGFCITSHAINHILESENITDAVNHNMFVMPKEVSADIVSKIDAIDISKYLPDQLEDAKRLGNNIIVRSSMHGEDGNFNFAGTYDSVFSDQKGLESAIKTVMKSYFSSNAIKDRESAGLAHRPGISMIIQEEIKGTGGVITITPEGANVTYARTSEDAVAGNGSVHSAPTIREALSGHRVMKGMIGDLEKLYDVFGNIDIEFVLDQKDVYLTQMRPKFVPAEKHAFDRTAFQRLTVDSLDDLKDLSLDRKYIVAMSFLNATENIMDRKELLMDFIRKNREYVAAIEGNMPSVAHIPNNIEGQHKIPYFCVRDINQHT